MKNYLILICSLFFFTSIDASNSPLDQQFQFQNSSGECPAWVENCEGTIKFQDGSVYTGKIKFGKPHGTGTLEWENGDVYSGNFNAGLRHGWGELNFHDNSSYSGNWEDGQMSGKGAYLYASGYQFIGNFANGNMEGQGVLFKPNGESYSGNWSSGLVEGEIVHTRTDGTIYTGQNQNGLAHGKGQIAWQNGDKLQGNWKNGNLEGESKLTYSNGDIMYNNWTNGKLGFHMAYQPKNMSMVKGSVKIVEEEMAMSDIVLYDDFVDNFSLGIYNFAMENLRKDKIATATSLLKLAAEYSFEKSDISIEVEHKLASLKEKKSAGGVARKEND